MAELAAAMGITDGALHHKLAGRRGWDKADIDKVLAFLTSKAGRPVTYEQVFDARPTADQAEPCSVRAGESQGPGAEREPSAAAPAPGSLSRS